ncbi:MAG: hypothetical protein KBA02_00145 [Paludibacteraceae bacterium]|nr:hypothetical protein [Paludibacteraceae bacterium]
MKAIKIKHNGKDRVSTWYPHQLKNGNIDLHVVTFIDGYYCASASYEIEITPEDLESNIKCLDKIDVSYEFVNAN